VCGSFCAHGNRKEDTMKVFVSTLCAAVLAFSPVAIGPASAGTIVPGGQNLAAPQTSADLVEVRNHRYQQNWRGGQRWDQRRYNPPRRHTQRSQRHRDRDRGPDLGSALIGALIGGVIVHQFQQQPRQQAPAYGGSFLSREHINWCQNRWRSYRLTDNSYQPYQGPRRVCISPYGPT
jgi:hypothetical protein